MDVAASAQERAVRTGVLLHAAPAADAQELERAADEQERVADPARGVNASDGIASFQCIGHRLRTLAAVVCSMSCVAVLRGIVAF